MVWAHSTQALAQPFNIWKANGVVFRRIEMHNTIQTPFTYTIIPCAIGLKSFTVSKFCMVEKSCWFTTDFQLSLPYCILYMVYIIERTKSIYHHVNILMVTQWTHVLAFHIIGYLVFQWWNANYTIYAIHSGGFFFLRIHFFPHFPIKN